VGHVQNLHHNPLFLFFWQHALQVHTVGYTCQIVRHTPDKSHIYSHILLVLAADVHFISIQEDAAKILSDSKNADVDYI